MLAPERYKRIMSEIEKNGHASIADLKQILGVSIDTVRRDLDSLEKAGKLSRVHGGAVMKEERVTNETFSRRKTANIEEKQELAAVAAQMIKENQAISMNAGTTNMELAKQLVAKFAKLTIVTNCLKVAEILASNKDFTIIILGGTLNNEEFALYGASVEEEICRYNLDAAFISVNAVSLEKGLTDFRQGQPSVIRAMIRSSKKAIAVVDSSKFETVSFMNVCDIHDIHAFVTNRTLDREILRKYEQYGVTIIQNG
ncbi:DeoR/GlpR family DNA-binding transcription regulator [Paenibacillus allorhizosphaerae]|uniref:HTH-type transcriptional repressor GlcR n=1 Tax=Paenibacillus allorhizosphaerae TaxID=2849866 RepID=A0ABN7TFD4_9BACL|nr:DeoR/GlpR family DNA-binding transcription regulator [Paenibacillus allorhizosphaerae]CAG7626220.1 HTH-type transcriptional repressor GlcR [Paenibacillus allorhizosphaerae]